jgi:hypothetical protein
MANKKTRKVRAVAKARPKAKGRKNPKAVTTQTMPKSVVSLNRGFFRRTTPQNPPALPLRCRERHFHRLRDKLEIAQHIANHESPRTTKLCGRKAG